jgi:NADH:ubiquinone oxidoreductase subunit 6 (subunit J)
VIETALFWLCAITAMAGAIGAAAVRNLFHAALLLGLALVGVAGLYLFLEASYLACIQVVVYLGGILVLVLFATLFSADITGAVQRAPWPLRVAGAVSAALAALVAARLAQTAMAHGADLSHARSPAGSVPDAIDGTRAIGDLLIGSWAVPFLVAALVLTAALVGAVAIVRRHREAAHA